MHEINRTPGMTVIIKTYAYINDLTLRHCERSEVIFMLRGNEPSRGHCQLMAIHKCIKSCLAKHAAT